MRIIEEIVTIFSSETNDRTIFNQYVYNLIHVMNTSVYGSDVMLNEAWLITHVWSHTDTRSLEIHLWRKQVRLSVMQFTFSVQCSLVDLFTFYSSRSTYSRLLLRQWLLPLQNVQNPAKSKVKNGRRPTPVAKFTWNSNLRTLAQETVGLQILENRQNGDQKASLSTIYS